MKIPAKFFPFAVRQPLWDMAKKHGRMKYSIVAIWDYMYWRSGKKNLFELAEDLVCLDLGCDPTTLRAVRRILIAEGWLRKETLRDKGGKWEVRGWTVIANILSTVPKPIGGEDQPPSREPAVAGPTVDSTSGGQHPRTVSSILCDPPSSCTPSASPSSGLRSDLLTDQLTSDSSGQEKEKPEPLRLSSEEQSKDKDKTRTTEWLAAQPYSPAKNLFFEFYPVYNDKLVAEQWASCLWLANHPIFAEDGVLAMLKWNRIHEGGKWRFRSPKQMVNALNAEGAHAVNNYFTHDFDGCPKCKSAGLKHYLTVREIAEMKEANARDQALIFQQHQKAHAVGRSFDPEEA